MVGKTLVSLATITKLMRSSNPRSRGLDDKQTAATVVTYDKNMTNQTPATTSAPASPTLTTCPSPVAERTEVLRRDSDIPQEIVISRESKSTDNSPVLNDAPSFGMRLKRHDTQESGSDSDATVSTDTSSRPRTPSRDDETDVEETTQGDEEAGDEAAGVEVESMAAAAYGVPGKLFLGGITLKTTEADLRAHFASFGSVADVTIIKHVPSGVSRGFGFLTFERHQSATSFLSHAKHHVINGHTIDVRHAVPQRLGRLRRMHGPRPKKSSQLNARPSTSISSLQMGARSRGGGFAAARGRAASCSNIDINSRSTKRTTDTQTDHVGSGLTLTLEEDIEESSVEGGEARQGPFPGMSRRYSSEPEPKVDGATTEESECETPTGMRWRAMSESVLCSTPSPTHSTAARHQEAFPVNTTAEEVVEEEEDEDTQSSISSDMTLMNNNAYKVFVGGLSPVVRTRDLREYFSTFGGVSDAVVLFDRRTNRSRGFGFVTFATAIDAENVCSPVRMHSYELMGKWIEVRSCESRETMASLASSVSLASEAMHSPSTTDSYQQQQQLEHQLQMHADGGGGEKLEELNRTGIVSARRYHKITRARGNNKRRGSKKIDAVGEQEEHQYTAVQDQGVSHGGDQYSNNYMQQQQQYAYAQQLQQQHQYQQQQQYQHQQYQQQQQQQQQYGQQCHQHTTAAMPPYGYYYYPSPPLSPQMTNHMNMYPPQQTQQYELSAESPQSHPSTPDDAVAMYHGHEALLCSVNDSSIPSPSQ